MKCQKYRIFQSKREFRTEEMLQSKDEKSEHFSMSSAVGTKAFGYKQNDSCD